MMKNLKIFETLFQLQVIAQYPDQRTKKQLIDEYKIPISVLNDWMEDNSPKTINRKLKIERLKCRNTTFVKINGITTVSKPRQTKAKSNPTTQRANEPYSKNNPPEIITQVRTATNTTFQKTEDDVIQTIYNQLKEAETEEQLITILEPITQKVEKINPKRFQQYLDLNISIIIKKTISKYFYIKIQNMKQSDISNIYTQSLIETDPLKILELFGEKYNQSAINNGVVTLSVKTVKKLLKQVLEHLCLDCNNANSNRCSKIRDSDKHCIHMYPFITTGYQQFNKQGTVDQFFVLECQNYQSDSEAKSFIKK